MQKVDSHPHAGPEVADFFSLLERHIGLSMGEEKIYLLSSRLKSLAQQEGCRDVPELLSRLFHGGLSDLHWKCFEAMTTQETSFFRDDFCFENLRAVVIPELLRKRVNQQRLRIWSAGASTGQEAYSLAMLLYDDFPDTRAWDIKILGTDLSRVAISKARTGVYHADELVRGLQSIHLHRHFSSDSGAQMRIGSEIKKRVDFQYMNLMGKDYPKEIFDLVLLRNVLIYFSPRDKEGILIRVGENMASDGSFLMLGSSETIFGDTVFQKCTAQRGYFFQYHA